MTIICAGHNGKRMWIGSDTLVDSAGTKLYKAFKWVVWGGWAVGVAGESRAQDVLEHHAKKLFDDLSGAFEFAERVRSIFKDHDFDLKPARDNQAPPNSGQWMILAKAPDRLWAIGPDFSILDMGDFAADGSGQAYALGAASVLSGISKGTIERCLEAAVKHVQRMHCDQRPSCAHP